MALNLGLIGLARKGGLISMGEEPTGSACRQGKAVAVFTANDAAENSQRRAKGFAELCGIPHFTLNADKQTLGYQCGRNSLAMFAVCDANLAITLATRFCTALDEDIDFLNAIAKRQKAKKTKKKK